MRSWVLAIIVSCAAQIAQAQDWDDLDALLFQNLTNSGTAEASYWLPIAPEPLHATAAIGLVYEYIPGSAGNSGIATGAFIRQANGWAFAGKVDGMFGQQQRDAAFSEGFVDVTTTMLAPNDARCCPSVPTRRRIDFGGLNAVQIN